MAKVLTAKASVRCSHPAPGLVTVSSASRRLTVAGSSVLLVADVQGASVTCPASNTDPNTSTKPCTSVAAVTATVATTLTVGGSPVLLDPLQGLTDGGPAGTVTLSASESQTRLRAT